MIPYVGSPQRGEPTYETPYTKSQTPLNGPNNTRSIMANSPITDVIFDFCGVLLDWNTRACLEGRFPDEIVNASAPTTIPCGFFRYEDRMDTGEDFADIYPDVVREQGQNSPTSSSSTSATTRTRCPARFRAWSSCWRI